MFAWTKTSNKGSTDPINARMFMGLSEILAISKLSSSQKEDIKILLYECSKDIIAAEERALIVINEIEEIELRKTQSSNINFFDSLQSLKSAIEFLVHAKSAFRSTSRIVGLIFSVIQKERWPKYKNAKFNEIEEDFLVIQKLPTNALVLKILETYKLWYGLLGKIADETRHPNSMDSCLKNYGYNSRPYFHATKESCFKEDVPLYEFMKSSSEYLLPFCEMLVLASLLEYLPEYIAIVEIPLEHRDPVCPKRFRVSLEGQEDLLG